ncbi:Trm112 family protein [Uliginosibacterium sp. 31-16]|uniref:Trm112 family protein n=1 Tax=Uliginosibacterium sp. 31-16 TaxID=3068315 RepID=UPI00273FEAB8|nr:Trm112 family protein [Uliginosibacterium sp. 31-16]MDP5240468.1 Trm112 family protein [Uliginosibacterium sp. 31-16]
MDPKLLEILVCPVCKGPLEHRRAAGELVCRPCRLAYAIKDGIPVMLADEARPLAADEAGAP